MTRAEAKKQAKEKYIELWGEKWVRENADHIGGSFCNLSNNMYEIAIDEWTPRPLEYYPTGEPIIWMGGDPKQHVKYRELLKYCKEKGIEPLDLTIREYNRFVITEAG